MSRIPRRNRIDPCATGHLMWEMAMDPNNRVKGRNTTPERILLNADPDGNYFQLMSPWEKD